MNAALRKKLIVAFVAAGLPATAAYIVDFDVYT